MTSADCAPRVPYCSKLGFCHGGTLPFDEEQLDILPDGRFTKGRLQPYPGGGDRGGAKTTFRIMTLSLRTFCTECQYEECRISFIGMLNVIILCVVLLNVIMPCGEGSVQFTSH